MSSIKFLLQSKSNPANIYVRLSMGRGQVWKRRTGLTINPKHWSKTKGLPTQKDIELSNLKADLLDMSVQLEQRLNASVRNGSNISGQWLQEQIDLINNKLPVHELDVLTNYIQQIIDTADSRVNRAGNLGLSKRRIMGYVTFKGVIHRFEDENYNGGKILIKNVDLKFAEEFKNWLLKKKYSINYVGKNIDNLKAVCHDAEKNGFRVSPTLKSIKSFSKQKRREEIVYLCEEEQRTIAEYPLKREALINARKWLLLGCLIGQRGSDLLSLTEQNIKELDKVRIIELKQAKTGKTVAIPLLPKAEEIISKGMPYPISLQKFNKYIKQICELSRIDNPTPGRKDHKEGIYPKYELVSSHVCRRSFATNFYAKIPTPILINITGHGTEKMFLKYIGKSSYESALQMIEYFNGL